MIKWVTMRRKTFQYAFVKTLPIMVSYFLIASGLGIVLQQNGWNWIFGVAMSLFIYTGAFQFVLASFLSSGASIITAVLTAMFMNSRQIFYGISFLDQFKKTGKWYPYMIHSLTDETYALYSSLQYPSDVDESQCMLYIALLAQGSWVAGTAAGSLLSTILPGTIEGIDFALTALFITIVMDQWKSNHNHTPVYIAFTVSIVLLVMLGADRFLLPSFAITAGLVVWKGNRS